MVNSFLKHMIGNIYKILPLKEESNDYLDEYIDSLLIQLNGAYNTYPELKTNVRYISVINTLQYFRNNNFTVKQCKREVFKCIDNIKKVQKDLLS